MNWSASKIGTFFKEPAHAIGLSTPPIGCVLDLPGLPGGGNKIYDRSPYGNHGTITGATWERLPSGLWVTHFDGVNDLINCGSGSSLDDLTNCTCLFWVYFDTSEYGEGNYPTMFEKTRYRFNIYSAGGPTHGRPWAYRYFEGGGSVTANSIGTEALSATTWYLLGYSFSSVDNKIRLYTNGVEVSYTEQVAGVGTLVSEAGDDLILGNRAGTDNTLDGMLALIRMYNRVLSALEIQNHYQQEKHLFGVW